MELMTIVEYWTIAVTFLTMASGMPSCYNMYKKKSTKNIPFYFFLISVMNSLFGACYGTLTGNSILFVVNVVGFLLWGFYILVFFFVSKTKIKCIIIIVMMMVVAGCHLKYISYFTDHREMTSMLGQILFVWSIIVLLTPALDVISVIQQGTSEGLSVSLLVGCTCSSLSWMFYGYLLKDVYIYGPSVPGTVVNIGKFIALFAYRKPSTSTKVE